MSKCSGTGGKPLFFYFSYRAFGPFSYRASMPFSYRASAAHCMLLLAGGCGGWSLSSMDGIVIIKDLEATFSL